MPIKITKKSRGRRIPWFRSKCCVLVVAVVLVACSTLYDYYYSSTFYEYYYNSIIGGGAITKKEALVASNTTKIIQDIPMNNNSFYVATDISKIVHIPEKFSIEVHLQDKANRRCQNPVFKGRISGWSLSLIDFAQENPKNGIEQQKSTTTDVISGTYNISQIPISGKYYVEIILLLCEGYDKDYRIADLKMKCIEPNVNNTITNESGFASIDIVVGDEKETSVSTMGRWLHKSFLANIEKDDRYQQQNQSSSANDDWILPPKPLFTRYQTKECKDKKKQLEDECMVNIDYHRFDAYTYRWKNYDFYKALSIKHLMDVGGNATNITASNEEEGLLPQENVHVCFLGASHSRVLTEHCQNILNEISITSLQCSVIAANYPRDFGIPYLSRMDKKGCTHVVVGLFQWYFSFKNNMKPITFATWKFRMKEVVEILETAVRSSDSPLRRILLRSAHSNGLKEQITRCPIADMRHPYSADVATTILWEIKNEISLNKTNANDNNTNIVSVVDTGFLLGPVWDAQTDWSHYDNHGTSREAGAFETMYILSEILKDNQVLGTET